MNSSEQVPLDLSELLRIAATSGIVSPPVVVKTFNVTFPFAAEALRTLAEKQYIEMLPESGIVPTYRVTRDGYATVEAQRGKKGMLGKLIAPALVIL